MAHVEAGLRSHDRLNPWPEEDFRVAIDAASDLLFAPTRLSASNLRREKVCGLVRVTGNTGIDALFERIPMLRSPSERGLERRLLVTCHRRESWGEGLEAIASSLSSIARRPDIRTSLVLHPNPSVAETMRRLVEGTSNFDLIEPCAHIEMLERMRDSDLILSDSGGMQEEAPALGIPLLILRDRTERPEAIASGNMLLVGRDPDLIAIGGARPAHRAQCCGIIEQAGDCAFDWACVATDCGRDRKLARARRQAGRTSIAIAPVDDSTSRAVAAARRPNVAACSSFRAA